VDTPTGTAWSAALVGFVAAVPLWRWTTHVITIAHEGGHALFGWLFGSTIKWIKITSDGGGGTMPVDENAVSRFISLLAGYLGPSIFGFGGAWMLVHDFDPRSVLLLSLVFLFGVLIMVRNVFGLFAVLVTGALLWVVAMRAEATVQLVFAYVWVWFLLMGGTRQIPELFLGVRGNDASTDAAHLQRHTYIGDVVWLFVFWLLSLGALVYGGALMLRHTT
jgi:hypothetical protein